MSHLYTYRHGRRFLRDAGNYPLPVDLEELNRQNLRTLMFMQVFGTPFCSEFDKPPKKILELACGSAIWSSICHDYFKREGQSNVSFTGLDIVPVAGDLKKQGVNWRFVQHDLRKRPLPFEKEEFDFIFVSDAMAMMATGTGTPTNPVASLEPYLKPGGMVEVWESDIVFRSLMPEPTTAPGTATEDAKQAEKSATYTISAVTPFAKTRNVFILDYNLWVERALLNLGLPTTPCALLGFGFSSHADGFEPEGNRRIAIPFSHIRWEDDNAPNQPNKMKKLGPGKGPAKQQTSVGRTYKPLTPDQAALRRTALTVVTGLIEALEPLLMAESGKKQDEWDRWWGGMMSDLFENDGTINGECLEIGAWWARKTRTRSTPKKS